MEYKVFITDYASYNEGSQFEFGHWCDLTDFEDADHFLEYVKDHFKKADSKRPLDSPREELMVTDSEGLPSKLYSESSMDWESVLMYIDLSKDEQIAFEIILGEYDVEYAFEHYEDRYPIEEDDIDDYVYDFFNDIYPEAAVAENGNDFVSIDYDRFRDRVFTKYTTVHGIYYFEDEGW